MSAFYRIFAKSLGILDTEHIGKTPVCFLFLVRPKEITHQFTHHFGKNPRFFGSETFLRRKVIFFVEISKG